MSAGVLRSRVPLPAALTWDGVTGWTDAGLPVTGAGAVGTYARQSPKAVVDASGQLYTVPSGRAGIHHRYDSARALWLPVGPALEGLGGNICLHSENFGGWTAIGSPTRVAAAARCGEVALDLIGDNSGGALLGYSRSITFTGNGAKGISLLIRQDVSTQSIVRLRDTTASADRLLVAFTWSGGQVVQTQYAGNVLVTEPERLRDGNGNRVYRVYLQSASVTAANAHTLELYPATNNALAASATGTVYLGGVHVSNTPWPGSYRRTGVDPELRQPDVLTLPFPRHVSELSIYVRGLNLATAHTTDARVWQWGNVANGAPRLLLQGQGDGTWSARYTDATPTTVSSAGAATGYGVPVELLTTITAGGVVTQAVSINGAAESVGTPSSALALVAALSEGTFHLGGLGTEAGHGAFVPQWVEIVARVRTFAQLRRRWWT